MGVICSQKKKDTKTRQKLYALAEGEANRYLQRKHAPAWVPLFTVDRLPETLTMME